MSKYGNLGPDPPKMKIFENFFFHEKRLIFALSECPQPLSYDHFSSRYGIYSHIWASGHTDGTPLFGWSVARGESHVGCPTRGVPCHGLAVCLFFFIFSLQIFLKRFYEIKDWLLWEKSVKNCPFILWNNIGKKCVYIFGGLRTIDYMPSSKCSNWWF